MFCAYRATEREKLYITPNSIQEHITWSVKCMTENRPNSGREIRPNPYDGFPVLWINSILSGRIPRPFCTKFMLIYSFLISPTCCFGLLENKKRDRNNIFFRIVRVEYLWAHDKAHGILTLVRYFKCNSHGKYALLSRLRQNCWNLIG